MYKHKNCIPSEITVFGYLDKEMKPVKKKSIDKVVFYYKEVSQ
jgi:hypothetical protein